MFQLLVGFFRICCYLLVWTLYNIFLKKNVSTVCFQRYTYSHEFKLAVHFSLCKKWSLKSCQYCASLFCNRCLSVCVKRWTAYFGGNPYSRGSKLAIDRYFSLLSGFDVLNNILDLNSLDAGSLSVSSLNVSCFNNTTHTFCFYY